MQRTTVLLLFGGESSEHDVSLSSARNVYAAIDNEKFDVQFGYIDRQGKWWLLDQFDDAGQPRGAPQLIPVVGSGSFVTIPETKIIHPDVIFPVLHGANGEDGSVQGLAQLLHIPCVGCDMTASAICMDKLATKEILSMHEVAVSPYVVHRAGEGAPDFATLVEQLGNPLFVKPTRAGSSVGVSKVQSMDELTAALDLAHQHDAVALIEKGIIGRELEVAVLGNPPNHTASGVGEIKPGEDFYSYEDKYATDSKSQVIIPAELDTAISEKIRAVAESAYATLGCQGLARVDFLLSEDGTVYINEVNTLPGFTNISMYPKLWRENGLTYSQLVSKLIHLAIDTSSNKSATL